MTLIATLVCSMMMLDTTDEMDRTEYTFRYQPLTLLLVFVTMFSPFLGVFFAFHANLDSWGVLRWAFISWLLSAVLLTIAYFLEKRVLVSQLYRLVARSILLGFMSILFIASLAALLVFRIWPGPLMIIGFMLGPYIMLVKTFKH